MKFRKVKVKYGVINTQLWAGPDTPFLESKSLISLIDTDLFNVLQLLRYYSDFGVQSE